MKTWFKAILLLQLFWVQVAAAHGPTPQKIDETQVIAAPIEMVWKKLGNFDAIADWHPMVSQVSSPEAGTRVLTLRGKGQITESLDELDATTYLMSYRLLEEDIQVFPVSFYSVSIQLTEKGEATQVNWKGRFYRADTGNFPPAEFNDEAAVAAMTEFADSGLAALKAQLEASQ